jgi:hypothetical protein
LAKNIRAFENNQFMGKQIRIIFILLGLSNILYSQDFKFKWQVRPSFSRAYTVKIERNESKSHILIKEIVANDSIKKKIDKSDCDTLVKFLKSYDFPVKGSTINGPIFRKYYDTKLLPDTNWVIFQGDSIRRKQLWWDGYSFDDDSNKYYTEIQKVITWTDGNTYEGEFIDYNNKKTFSVYCARISEKDYGLNKLILHFIIKYDTKNDYARLKEMIERDKPRN